MLISNRSPLAVTQGNQDNKSHTHTHPVKSTEKHNTRQYYKKKLRSVCKVIIEANHRTVENPRLKISIKLQEKRTTGQSNSKGIGVNDYMTVLFYFNKCLR